MDTYIPLGARVSSDYLAGIEALCNHLRPSSEKDLALCFVCLQWTCDGPQCHRSELCPATDAAQ